MIDRDTQIKVLLYGNPYQFACHTLNVSDMRNHSYEDVFTVKEPGIPFSVNAESRLTRNSFRIPKRQKTTSSRCC